MKKTFFLSAVGCIFFFTGRGQRFTAALNNFFSLVPSEKMYIHYDKDYYFIGETIWFKVYLTENNLPGSQSKNFFIQLCDKNDSTINSKNYFIKTTVVSGDIDIPVSLATGEYHIKAYTPSMIGADTTLMYSKKILIYGWAPEKDANSRAASLPEFPGSIHFFAEGGSFISGINTILGFEALNGWGYPADVSGHIETSDGVHIASFSSYHDGIGRVEIIPEAGKKYFAVATINNKTVRTALPEVQQAGFALSVQDEENGKSFVVSRSREEEGSTDIFKIVARLNNTVVYENVFSFGNNFEAGQTFLTDSLPSGIMQITVFDKNDMPLLERLTFINNREYESGAAVSIVKQGTGPREENKLLFSFPDTALRSCSVSITDYQSESVNGRDNIISSTLLTSDLKGEIFNPAYYFNTNGDSARIAMDNLMLTHGWRRFVLKKILNNEYSYQKKYDDFPKAITGTVKFENSNATVKGGTIRLFVHSKDSVLREYNYPVSNKGSVVLDSILIRGRAKIFYSYTNASGNEKAVDLFPDVKKNIVFPSVIGENNAEEINFLPGLFNEPLNMAGLKKIQASGLKQDTATTLEGVTVVASQKRAIDLLNEKYATGLFKTGSRYIIDNINVPVRKIGGGPGRVVSYILYNLPRVGFIGNDFINLNHAISELSSIWKVGVFIDEFPANVDELDYLRVEQIVMVKFFDAGFIGVGQDYGGGAIAIYTNRSDTGNNKISGEKFFWHDGYAAEREFYSPDYSRTPEYKTGKDTRATLFWKSSIGTGGKEMTIPVTFFNNDISKKFRVVMEGFDNRGRLIHLEKIIGGNE